jgi:hypothetical protein
MKYFTRNKDFFFIIILSFTIFYSLKQEVVWTESKSVKKEKIEKAIWDYLDSKEKLLECKKSFKHKGTCKGEVKKVIKYMKSMDKAVFGKT